MPSNGLLSDTHHGFLTDFDIELVGICITIKGASTKTATPLTTGPFIINFSIHVWDSNNTVEYPFSVSIPVGYPGISGTIGGLDSSNFVNSNIKYQTSSINGIVKYL